MKARERNLAGFFLLHQFPIKKSLWRSFAKRQRRNVIAWANATAQVKGVEGDKR